jgi:hypothetical protein
MFVQQLKSIVYPPDGSRWFIETTEHPSCENIEAALRRLDRDQFPFIYLFQDAEAADDAVPDFTVMGGQGAYTFGPEDTLFYDETHSDTEIHVWTSDQGASFPDWQVCHDFDIVLRATRLFAETGQLDPTVTWKTAER